SQGYAARLDSSCIERRLFGRLGAGISQVLRHRVDDAFERAQGPAAAVGARFEGRKLFDPCDESPFLLRPRRLVRVLRRAQSLPPFLSPPPRCSFLACRHSLQRLGGLVKPFSWKNSCSPAVQVKSRLQSAHVSCWSLYSLICYRLSSAKVVSLARASSRVHIVLLILLLTGRNR